MVLVIIAVVLVVGKELIGVTKRSRGFVAANQHCPDMFGLCDS